ncbi:AAA family ATPase [Dactylosporangium sp. NPDC005572]|uniref:ATP-binding protein n=1 Tax=Dactylosporangium sp. NPDC005572 TaxID=3156889 RepID=UPI0033B1AF0C
MIVRGGGTFVGRGAELTAMLAAYEDERVSTVLLSGEAGIGKSRLLHEFATRLGPEPLVLPGRCVEFGNDGIPFAPFVAPLRGLVRAAEGREPAATVSAWLSGSGPVDQIGLLGAVLTLLEETADTRPLVLVLEDLHWADGSSLQLLSFLVANLAHPGVFLAGSHRPPTGALRQLVTELSRVPAVLRIEPAPLSRHEVGRQLAGLLGREPEPALAARVAERSHGNPLFVQALARSPRDSPAELLDLLYAGLPDLDDDARQVLAVASVAGTVAEHELVEAVADLPEARLDAALRRLVDEHVLSATGAAYAFRHALVRQAVYERLLPVRRARLHQRLAGLEREPARVAAHAEAAGDLPRALDAAWRAAGRAGRAGTEPERLHLLRQVLDLWDRVPDAATVVGADRLTVLDQAVVAAHATGSVALGLDWSAQAIAAAPDAARYYRQARLKNLNRAGGRDDLLAALALDPPAELRAAILVDLAAVEVFAGDMASAERRAREALGLTSKGPVLATAHAYLALATGADVHFAQARALADAPTLTTVATWEAAARIAVGGYAAAIEAIRAGIGAAHETYEYARHGPILVVKWVQALTALGRGQDALDLVDEALGEPYLPPLSHAALLISRGEIELARGDGAAASASAAAARDLVGDEPWARPYRIRLGTLEARLTPSRAPEIYAATAAVADLSAHPHEAWALLAEARPADRPDLPVVGPVDAAYRAMSEARWEEAAEGWRALGQPYELSRCLFQAPLPVVRRPSAPPAMGLTAREHDVLRLVAEGRTNRQIAAALFISANTAGVHVSRILTKLGAATRTEAARRYLDAGSA